VGLTEAGERLLDEAGRHLDGIEQVLTCISGHNDRPAGMVRIVASDHKPRVSSSPRWSMS
jgi:DNA-binding transcriptional LysR family regulator